MPKLAKTVKTTLNLFCPLTLFFTYLLLDSALADYASKIEHLKVVQIEDAYKLNVRVHYAISPTAKLAIEKGVPLSWSLSLELQKKGLFWNSVVFERKITFVIQYHALLNLYSVENVNTSQIEQFSSFNAAIQQLSDIQNIRVPTAPMNKTEQYQFALKIQFNREFLPIPLRPESYFKSQWAMSSDWFIWPL